MYPHTSAPNSHFKLPDTWQRGLNKVKCKWFSEMKDLYIQSDSVITSWKGFCVVTNEALLTE